MVLLDLNDLVTPGLIPLGLTGILLLAVTGLFFNMRKHLRRIDVPVDVDRPQSSRFAGPGE